MAMSFNKAPGPGETRDCTDPWNFVIVRSNGDVSLCCRSEVVGNVKRTPLPEVLESDQAKELRRGVWTGKLNYDCLRCSERGVATIEDLRARVRRGVSDRAAEEIANLRSERHVLRQIRSELLKERAGLHGHVGAIEGERDQLGRHAATLESELASLRAHGEALEAELARLREHAKVLEAERPQLRGHIANLEGENAALKGHADTLERENSGLKGHARAMDSDARGLREHAQALEAELRGVHGHAQALEAERPHLQGHIQNLEREVANLHARLEATRNPIRRILGLAKPK